MNFLIFLLYYTICTFLYTILIVFGYKLYVKRKVLKISRENEKKIEEFWKEWEKVEEKTINDSFDRY